MKVMYKPISGTTARMMAIAAKAGQSSMIHCHIVEFTSSRSFCVSFALL